MSDTSYNKENIKPVIGISIGDFNGIGPEVVIKSLNDNRMLKHMTPVIYADSKIISFYRKQLNVQNFSYNQAKSADKIQHGKVNVVHLHDQNAEVTPGVATDVSGKYAVLSLKKAVDDLKNGLVDAICTAPLSKDNVQSEDFKFPGHTEYLTEADGKSQSLMFLVSEGLRVGVVTGHIPLKKVPEVLTRELLRSKLDLMIKSLKLDFSIKKPRIAVLGLNPHAGENGLLGDEEINIITPTINELKEKGHLVFGPYPADGFFGSSQFKSFDGIMAIYHDQGLIPFKSMAFETGVNFTAGLSFVRTSPDHGTGFPIAGKDQADETSMRHALYTAADIAISRKDQQSK